MMDAFVSGNTPHTPYSIFDQHFFATEEFDGERLTLQIASDADKPIRRTSLASDASTCWSRDRSRNVDFANPLWSLPA